MRKRIKSSIKITDYKLVDKRIAVNRIKKHYKHIKMVEILELKGYKVINNDSKTSDLSCNTIKHKQVKDTFRHFYGQVTV